MNSVTLAIRIFQLSIPPPVRKKKTGTQPLRDSNAQLFPGAIERNEKATWYKIQEADRCGHHVGLS